MGDDACYRVERIKAEEIYVRSDDSVVYQRSEKSLTFIEYFAYFSLTSH